MKRYIYASAKSRKDIGDELEDGVRELLFDMIKLRFYPQSQFVPKQRRAVAEKLNKVSMLKWSHKYPSVEFILDNTWREHNTQLDYYMHIIESDYGTPSGYIDSYTLYHDIEAYFIWLAIRLSAKGQIPYEDIVKYLSQSGF